MIDVAKETDSVHLQTLYTCSWCRKGKKKQMMQLSRL